MDRYRVYIVPKTGRFAPLLTVLVDAESRDEALMTAQVRCRRTKAVSAENVRRLPATDIQVWTPEPRLYAPTI